MHFKKKHVLCGIGDVKIINLHSFFPDIDVYQKYSSFLFNHSFTWHTCQLLIVKNPEDRGKKPKRFHENAGGFHHVVK